MVHSAPILCFASPTYWPDRSQLIETFEGMRPVLAECLRRDGEGPGDPDIRLWYDDGWLFGQPMPAGPSHDRSGFAFFLPMSGGVQPAMLDVASHIEHVALLNAYLADPLPEAIAHDLMHRNAHPSCTDFFAHLRLSGRNPVWMKDLSEMGCASRAWNAVERLRNAHILKIGETEPWVINSCRDPERFTEAFGTRITPLALDALYEATEAVPETRARALSDDWLGGASDLEGPSPADVVKACSVVAAMEDLLDRHSADGLSIACFAMIGDLDTTSCLALSFLNDSADKIGACEGDLEAAVTLYLMKALDADFVWIANPIIGKGNAVDLAHCTAPRCACGLNLEYRLMRHHESGRGVAPEVKLPGDQEVTLARIGNNLTQIAVHSGRTRRMPKQPSCHTQIRVELDSVDAFIENLLGTHVILSYGDYTRELDFAARFLGLEKIPSVART